MEPESRDVEASFQELISAIRSGREPDVSEFSGGRPDLEAQLNARLAAWRGAGRVLERLGVATPHAGDDFTPVAGSARDARVSLESDRYSIQGEIARGGMGAIFSVHDEQFGRDLAMKVLLDEGARIRSRGPSSRSEGRRQRFLNEARITGRLEHPGIVPVHELGVDGEGRPFFTMKLVRGRTLREVFKLVREGEDEWSLQRALGVLLRVCEAVGFAHDKGIVHRDLKPANLMVGKFGEVYVMDWGVARDESSDANGPSMSSPSTTEAKSPPADVERRTRDGDVVGTPEYMAPEQALGDRERIGPTSDVFAMGAMLYELLTGETPHGVRGSRSPAARLAAALGRQADDVFTLAPDTPAELCAICQRAIARDPSERYPTMVALGEDLRAYLEGRVVSAYETGAWVEARKWIQRNKPLAASLAAAVALLIGGLATSLVFKAKADDNALLAQTQAGIAADNERDARAQERVATKLANDVFLLAAAQDCEDLMVESAKLWPAYPGRIEELGAWLSKAKDLRGELPVLRAKRDELRAQALPRTQEQRRAERESHPEFARLAILRADLDTKNRAMAVRRGEAPLELPSVDWSEYPADAVNLNYLAWAMVKPGREAFGQEALGVALATRAAASATGKDRSPCFDSIAWGRFALGDHQGALAASREALAAALPWAQPEFATYLATLEAAVAKEPGLEGLTAVEAEVAALESSYAEVEARVDLRRTWAFPEELGEETKARWWHNRLTGLIDELESFSIAGTGLLTERGTSPEHGWSVPRRLAFAQRLQEAFADGGEYARRWDQALPAIREAYPGLELTSQMGLVPIGPDPDSELWEFWHVQSGSEPVREESGKLTLEEASGLVFVLLPGGEFFMGAQLVNPDGRNYDPYARPNEVPIHRVQLSAFFMSKYEMTQGQWMRQTGVNPSRYPPSFSRFDYPVDLTHPVEEAVWSDCRRLLEVLGLTLPSEAQWEYAGRAGTDSIWWTGNDRESLRTQHAANVADQTAAKTDAQWPATDEWPELNDGYAIHAPVNEYAANAFGLHNVVGNVWEWCLDGYDGDYYEPSSAPDPISGPEGFKFRLARGGGFSSPASFSRSAVRRHSTPSNDGDALGLRPARFITE